jgi:hypothetical protein
MVQYRIYSCNFHPFFCQFSRQRTAVLKLCEEILESIVLQVTFKLGPEIGIHKHEMKHFGVII